MKAGNITLDEVRHLAKGIEGLNIVLSFIQVEEGISELEACWDGFRDAANYFNQEFDNERDCAIQFGLSAADFYEIPKLVFG